jgi:hypothetical protein
MWEMIAARIVKLFQNWIAGNYARQFVSVSIRLLY